MKKTNIILITMILLTMISASAVKTCINQTNTTLCFDVNQDMYESGISFYEGLNDKYGLYIENPDQKPATWVEYTLDFVIPKWLRENEVTPSKLGDDTVFSFNSYEDFYNTLQQKNAIGNITLFTQANLYQQQRTKTTALTNEVINWTYILLIMIMEFTRIIIDLSLILVTIFLIFRGIPKALNFVKKMTISFYIWSKK